MRCSMLRLSVLRALLWALVAGLVTACATAPGTGRSQLLLMSPGEEAQMGLQAFSQLKRKTPIARSPSQQAMVRRVGQRVAAVVSLPHAQWEFVVFEDSSPNAFALPGGKVGVHTGILPITKNEAGLATVIGHEVAHAVARHGAERMSQQTAIQLGGVALSAVLGDKSAATRDIAMQAYGVGTTLGVALPYSRTQELEADHLGLLYMARAGYDPREAIAFWQRFADHTRRQGGRSPEFLSTHPLDQRRIDRLTQLMPKAMAEYQRARQRHR